MRNAVERLGKIKKDTSVGVELFVFLCPIVQSIDSSCVTADRPLI